MVDTGTAGERIDSDPAWSPDSKTLAVLSTAGEKDQKQLWTVNADGSDPKKLTKLAGYAARPRWSRDGKQIAFLYIEGAGGGGPEPSAFTVQSCFWSFSPAVERTASVLESGDQAGSESILSPAVPVSTIATGVFPDVL